jgi:hypothetical protein
MNLLMIIVSIIGSYVREISSTSASVVHNYISAQDSPTECHFKHSSHLLLLSQTNPPIKLSANDFFDITKGLVVSTWISVSTYIIIIISWKGVFS